MGKEVFNDGIHKSLDSYFNPNRWSCEKCCKFDKTKSKRTIFSIPRTLFLILDLEYKKLIKFSRYEIQINLQNKSLSLWAAVLKPSANHFALLVKNAENTSSKWYHFDDLMNQGDLIPISNFSRKTLNDYGAYILIYEEENSKVQICLYKWFNASL